ncbi:hypothetical protein vseg_000541 [Gypsophila vaccaria]
MGSNFFGISNMRSEKSSSSSLSSKKNKKSNGSDKPKQPQRGLGVAQLEQIRLRSQITTCGFNNPPSNIIQENMMRMQGIGSYGYLDYSPPSSSTLSTYYGHHHPNNPMVSFENENLRYQDYETRTNDNFRGTRWSPNNVDVLNNSTYRQPGMSFQQLPTYFEDQRHNRINSMCPISQITHSSDHDDVDLELRL